MPATVDNAPIPYMQRTRDYYLALGYDNPYRWAHYEDVPFAPLVKPLAESRLALITTAAPYRPEAGDQGPDATLNTSGKFVAVYSLPSDSDPDLRIAHVSYDRAHTTAADPNCWFPLARLREAVEAGQLGGLTTHVNGVPTNRSQRTTIERYAPELLARCRADGADVALLVPT